MESFVESPLQPWMTVWPAALATVMLVVGAVRLRKAIRPSWELGVVLALALAVRVLWVPLGRHEFDGHEAEYLEIFLGNRALTQGGTLLYPAMQWLYRGMGIGPDWPWLLQAFSVAAALVGIAAFVGFVTRLTSRPVGLAAGTALALLGNHAAWSSSVYNVVLPLTLALVALWALAVLIRRGDPLGAGLLAGGAAALAVATRLETLLVAPIGVALLLVYRPPKAQLWLPGLVGGALLGVAAAWYITWSGETPGTGQRALAWSTNRTLFTYWAPWDRWWMWPSALVGLGLCARKWPGLAGVVGVSVVGLHCVMATFDDFGARHVLVGQVLLAACVGALVLEKWAWPLVAVAAGGLLVDLVELRARFYASEEAFAESLDPELPRWTVDELGPCALICEDSRVVPEGEQLSHFNLLDPAEFDGLRADHGCVYWLVGLQDHRWSSRAVRDRTQRLEHLYALEPRAVVQRDADGYVGLVVEVNDRRSGE
jgi:hypothetical protein